MINTIRDSGLLLVLLVLPLTILADNLLGAAKAGVSPKEHFDPTVLKQGLTKGALVYSGVLVYAFISYLMADLKVAIGADVYSLIDAMYVILLAAVVKFAKDGIVKLIEITKYKKDVEEE